jgi:branched-chain amino acid transport system permease protein
LGFSAFAIAGLGLLLYRTSIGLQMRAAAENFEMARLLGVRADRVISVSFAISGALAAAVAVILVIQTGQVSPTMGLTPVLVGFVAVVIGGFGRLSGALIGGLVLGALSSFLGAYLPPGVEPFRDAIVFAVPIGILLVRPYGLLGNAYGQARV